MVDLNRHDRGVPRDEVRKLEIDTTFDFRTDTPLDSKGRRRDPDSYSPTLQRYHQLLWSKPLPSGEVFALEAPDRKPYRLYHRSHLGEFVLSSDAVIPTFRKMGKKSAKSREPIVQVIRQLPAEEIERFNTLTYTIGAMMIFPANRMGRKLTINGHRGFSREIRDRFDFTLECIRRFYRGGESPLRETLERYSSFFALFGDFRGYVDFFLLQDLVDAEYEKVRFFLPFDEFGQTSPFPESLDEYREYERRALEFVDTRNRRIRKYCSEAL